MPELDALRELADALGVHLHFVDGLGRPRTAAPETLVRICAALGAPLGDVADAPDALRAHRAEAARAAERLPPVVVAWDGVLPPLPGLGGDRPPPRVRLEDGREAQGSDPLPPGVHTLEAEDSRGGPACTVISAPIRAWRAEGAARGWGVQAHLAALRSRRSRSVGDLRDLERVCRWVGDLGGDVVSVLPLLPTFDSPPAEPSPYSPVSRLVWSELILDLHEAHRSTPRPDRLDVVRASAEVRAALAGAPLPDVTRLDDEVRRYARFRGAQARLGRNWRDWPGPARDGRLTAAQVDPDEERFHLVAQARVRDQLGRLTAVMRSAGVRLGLDLAVGVHPDGYDPWSRPGLFAPGISVGAPPDPGFPSGQDWGFAPMVPGASRAEGHRYLAASIAHQASLAGVLRIDHVMSLSRLYWIPHGLDLHEGTYVSYPADELFAVVVLASHRTRCEVVGENLGTVPPEIGERLGRHGIRGMYFAIFAAENPEPSAPRDDEVAHVGSHDTPPLAGWVEGRDIDERVRTGLLDAAAAPAERDRRAAAVERLAAVVGASPDDDPADLLTRLLAWLGASSSPLVLPWIEDLWLEADPVNLPGTSSWARPNWQRPMARLLDDVLSDPAVRARITALADARRAAPDAR